MADILQFPPNRTPEREPEREPEPLWREVLGRNLRATREEQGSRLVDIAERAGISPQYLSEIERGRKEPSSEMIAALAGAFDLTLIDLATLVTEDLRRHQAATAGPGLRNVPGTTVPSTTASSTGSIDCRPDSFFSWRRM